MVIVNSPSVIVEHQPTALPAWPTAPARHSAAPGSATNVAATRTPMGSGDPVTKRARLNERCSALLISLLVVGFTSVRSARNSDHPSALPAGADGIIQRCASPSLLLIIDYRKLNVGL